ncbi:DNA-binding protein [Candidatus Woesearchaeota archaeon]|nr:DNA-binding protein [Candidatus Woesearchaeota archaeon]
MKRIILDTNFLLIPYNFHVDIFAEIDRICHFPYQLVVLDATINELKRIIERQRGRHRDAAKFALLLINKKDLYTPANSTEHIADDVIVEIADKDTIVATQDKVLGKRLKEKNIRRIVLRNKKYLEMI